MDAVLPLTAADLERFEILRRSLVRNVVGLDTLWVIVPDADLPAISVAVSQSLGPQLCLVPELSWLPELKVFTRVGGWYRQMLLKLEAANHVRSDFYLTLDADVIATRKHDLNELCVGGRAPCHVDHQDLHPKWYAAARDLLGLPLPRAGISHGVTPALLHAQSVRRLQEHLARRWEGGRYGTGLRGFKQRLGKARTWIEPGSAVEPWRALLACSRPWAEYALYFSFLEATGSFERYCEERDECLYSVHGSVWSEKAFASWDPKSSFQGSGPPYFIVVQSNTHIPADAVAKRVAPYL